MSRRAGDVGGVVNARCELTQREEPGSCIVHLRPGVLALTSGDLKFEMSQLWPSLNLRETADPNVEMPDCDFSTRVGTAPNGNPVFMVEVYSSPPDVMDGGSGWVVVDPTDNVFWAAETGMDGFFGKGPLPLPEGSRFSSDRHTAQDMHTLARPRPIIIENPFGF
jgi:hypothetical protein